jgi:hypothetical protein
MSTHPNQIGTDPIAAAGKAKTVCTIARQSRPPEFVASLRDADTETCRTSSGMSAAASGIRYAGEGWARVPIRLPLPRPEWNVKSGAAICALMKTLAGIGRVYRDGRRRGSVVGSGIAAAKYSDAQARCQQSTWLRCTICTMSGPPRPQRAHGTPSGARPRTRKGALAVTPLGFQDQSASPSAYNSSSAKT